MQMSPCQYLRWAEREVRRNLILGPCLPSPCQHRNAPDLRYPPRAALVSLPPQREPRCEAVRSPLSPRSQVLTFLRSLASSEANPEKMFSACFSASPRLRVKQHLSNSTRSRPRRNSRRAQREVRRNLWVHVFPPPASIEMHQTNCGIRRALSWSAFHPSVSLAAKPYDLRCLRARRF